MSSSRQQLARRAVAAGLALTLALGTGAGLSACSADGDSTTSASSEITVSDAGTASAATGSLIDTSSLFSDRDLDPSYDEDDIVATIELSDDGTSVDGSGVTVDGSEITITAEGVYVVSGTLSDGRIVVDVGDDEKVQIVLDGASVTCSGASALYVRNADKVFLTLASGSQNTLAATGGDAEEDDHNLDGTVFSCDDLTINGDGALEVSSAQGHGIVGKDDLTLVSGEVTVTASGHAIQANDSVAVAGGTWDLTGGTDGIHCENEDDTSLGYIYVGGGTITVTAASDGFDASGVLQVDDGTIEVAAGDDGLHAEYDLTIYGGTITITESYEGIEGSTVTIAGGTIDITSSDDGINAAGEPDGDGAEGADSGSHWSMMEAGGDENDDTAWLLISGSTLTIDAQGDGIDSNGDLTITGGEIYVTGPSSGADGALDYAGTGTITGGTLVAVGSSSMAQNLGEDSTQVSLLVSLSGEAGQELTLCDSDGTVLASYTPSRSYDSVVVSAPGMDVGETYTVSSGSSSTEVTADSTSVSEVGLGGVMGQSPGGGMGGMVTMGDGGTGQDDVVMGDGADGGMMGGSPGR